MDNSYETPAIEETVSVTEPLNVVKPSSDQVNPTPTWRRRTEK